MTANVSFELRFTAKSGIASFREIREIRDICDQARSDCVWSGMCGRYWFRVTEKREYISVLLYSYYARDDTGRQTALDNVLEATWLDEVNGALIIDAYFQYFSEAYFIEVVRDYYDLC